MEKDAKISVSMLELGWNGCSLCNTQSLESWKILCKSLEYLTIL